jgi:hypothetical protein
MELGRSLSFFRATTDEIPALQANMPVVHPAFERRRSVTAVLSLSPLIRRAVVIASHHDQPSKGVSHDSKVDYR